MKCIDLELFYNIYLYNTPCPLHASWIELYLNMLIEIWIELNSNATKIQFNNWVKIQLNWTQNQLENNEMQIGGETIEILLVNIVLENFFLKTLIWKRNISMSLYLGMG